MIQSKKVVCIVQARMGSTRLPGKVMMPILGEPMIGYTLKRLKSSKTIDDIVLATSLNKEDDKLAAYAAQIGFEVFRGSEEDVLERYVLANRKYGGEIVIRVTGDCPLIDSELVDFAVEAFSVSGKDYLAIDKNASAMRGIDTEVFSADALERAHLTVSKLDDPKNYKEHVTIYMYSHPDEFSLIGVKAKKGLKRPYRLCVDEIDDFRVIEAIFNHFNNPYPTITEVVEFLDANPEIAALNAGVEQKKA